MTRTHTTLHTPLRRSLTALALASACLGGWGFAQAQSAAAGAPQATAAAPAAPALSIRDIYDRMEAAGYRQIREIEWDAGRYEVKADNAQGERVKLQVNAQTGAVEHSRVRSKKGS